VAAAGENVVPEVGLAVVGRLKRGFFSFTGIMAHFFSLAG
jgi:hypothetical protein